MGSYRAAAAQEAREAQGGRPRIPDRAALTGIIFVLKSGILWEMLPQEMGCGSRSTCWRRLRDWEEAGVCEKLHRVLLDRLGQADEIDWERASLDSASVAARRGGEKVGKNQTERGKPGSKRHLVSDRKGVPLAVVLTSANVHDSNVFEKLVDAIEPIKLPGRGRPRKRPVKLHADKGYDAKKCRRALRKRGIKSRIASQEGQRKQQAVGAVPVGGGAHAGVAGEVPQADGALRAASGHPRSVPPPRLFLDLPQLPDVRVLQCALSCHFRRVFSETGFRHCLFLENLPPRRNPSVDGL